MENQEKRGTIYQQLNQLFNFTGIENVDSQSTVIPQTPPSDIGSNKKYEPKIIIKGKSPEEVKRKALEIEQKKELQNKFFRTIDRGYQKALQYEAARLPAYIDYEGMEYYPIISSALDLYMEEATTIGLNGKMLNIFSNKERIKRTLEELFYNIINVNVNLPFWTRNVCKYGDNFVLLYGERKKGITHVKQLVNYEIERFDRVVNGKPVVVFRERMTGDEFNVFEIAHFRLLGDDKYLPYGSSILNKVRRVFRQLVMAEDAMLTYRIVRAGEKKVFKIDVGNIDEEDIEEYIYKVATKFKKIAQIQPNDGQIDYRFNILGNDEDYFIPVRNANVQTGIDTLPGASNLDQIQDIEYLRDNLFSGLGIPKPFLSFQDAIGGGKNMAQYDIRFAKKVNRVQQAVIQELNKIATIHLFLLGFTGDDLLNFQLTLTNPSTQQELMKAELLREKAQTYENLTRGEGGIAAMSHTRAKRILLNMTDREIVEDLRQQKLERVIMQELADAPIKLKSTGLFADIDKRFSGGTAGEEETYAQPTQSAEQPSLGGGMVSGREFTPPEMGATSPAPETAPPTPATSPAGAPETPPATPATPVAENFNRNNIIDLSKFDNLVNMLVFNYSEENNNNGALKNEIQETKLIVEEMNDKAIKYINEIDELINNAKNIKENIENDIDLESDNIIDNIDDFDEKLLD